MPLPALAAIGAVQGLFGLGQTLLGAGKAKRAQRNLENLISNAPKTTSSASISDYYNKASQNPYETSMYKMQQQNINRGTSAGLSMLQDRRSGLAGISGIIRGQNDALLRAGANAEQQQWSRLADATRLKSADDQRVFQINQMLPFQQKLSLFSSQAAGANQGVNAGVQNIFGGAQTAAMGFMNNKNQTQLGY
jgi:hypothetical protein